jgi:hypothetical protein
MLIAYNIVMWASAEFLNRNTIYKQMRFKRYNALAFFLVLFITVDRSRTPNPNVNIEVAINSFEHFLFTAIVGAIICIYLFIFTNIGTPLKRVIIAMLLFNIIGIINEFYQNLFKAYPFLSVQEDSKLDIAVNAASSIICVLWVYSAGNSFARKNP